MTDFKTSNRGFKQFDPVVTDYGHTVQVYESSRASLPCLWMAVDANSAANGDSGELHVHMTIEQAAALRDIIDAAIKNHYQYDDDSDRI